MATLKTYALDLTGAKASNKIAGEVKTISKDADRVFIPTGGPFYTKTLKVWSGTTLLKPLVDYVALELNREGTVDSGKEVCNVLYIKNAANSFKLDYQVIGGQYADLTNELTALINATPIDKLNVLTWGSILNKPTTFPPTAHTHYPYEWRGYTQVIHLLEQLRQVVVAGDAASISSVYQYIENNVKDIAMDYINKNNLFFIDKTPTPNGNVLLDGLGTPGAPLKINLEQLLKELDVRYFQNSINPLSRVGAISDSFLPISAGFFNCACPLNNEVSMSIVGNVERNGDLLILSPATNGEIIRYVYGYVRGWSGDADIARYKATNQQYRPPGLAVNEEIMDLCGYHEQSMIGAIFTIGADGVAKYKEHCIIWLNGTMAAENHVIVRVGNNITKTIDTTVAGLYACSPRVVKLRRGEIYLLAYSRTTEVDVFSFNPSNTTFARLAGWTGILQKNVIDETKLVTEDVIKSTIESTFATGQTQPRPFAFWPEYALRDADGNPTEFVVMDIEEKSTNPSTTHNRPHPGTGRQRMQVRVVGDKILLYTVSSHQIWIYDPVYRGGNFNYFGFSLEVTPLDLKYRWVRHVRAGDYYGGAGTTEERGILNVYESWSSGVVPYDLYSNLHWWENFQAHTLLALNDGRVLNWSHPTTYGYDIGLQAYQYAKTLAEPLNVDRMFNLYFNTKYTSHAQYGAGRNKSIGTNILNFPSPTVNNVNGLAVILADDTVVMQERSADPRTASWGNCRHTAYRPSKKVIDYPTTSHGLLRGYDTSNDRKLILSDDGASTQDLIPWVSVRRANGTRKVGSLVWYRPREGWVDQAAPANVAINWTTGKLTKTELHTMNLQTYNAIEDFVKANLIAGTTADLLHHTWSVIASPENPTMGILFYYGGRSDRIINDRAIQVKIAYNAAKVMTSINFVGGLLLDRVAGMIPNVIHDPRYAFARLQWVIEYNADMTESFWAGKLPNATGHYGDIWSRPTVFTFHQTINGSGVAEFTGKGNYYGDGSGTGAFKSLVATADGVGFMTDTVGFGVYRGLTRFKSLSYDSGSVMRDEKPFVWFTPRPPSDFSLSVTDVIDVQIGGVFGRIEPVTYDLTDPTVSDVIDPRNKTIYIYVVLELGKPKINFREVPIAESIYATYIGKCITDGYGVMELDIQPVTRIGNYRPSATPRGASFSVSSGTADTERLLNWDANIPNSESDGGSTDNPDGGTDTSTPPATVNSNPGTYTYTLAPGDTYTVEMLGGGGGGGAATWAVMADIGDGLVGGDSILSVDGIPMLIAHGGGGGGLSMIFDITQISQGMPGVGGTGVINSGNFEVLVDNVVLGSGLIGNNTLENHSGGGVFKVIGTGNFGYGGDGSDGMLFGPESGMSVDGFVGGGGGGAGYASARIKNDTNDIVTVTVVVAAGGSDTHAQESCEFEIGFSYHTDIG